MSICYRLATEGDLEALAMMRWDFRTKEEGAPEGIDKNQFLLACTEFLHDGLSSRQWFYWLAVDGENIVAHVFVQLIRKIPKPERLDDRYGYITNVYTKPDFRGRGIGHKLMTKVTAWAEQEDLDTLIVWPSEESVSFYQRLGFQVENEVMEYVLRGE